MNTKSLKEILALITDSNYRIAIFTIPWKLLFVDKKTKQYFDQTKHIAQISFKEFITHLHFDQSLKKEKDIQELAELISCIGDDKQHWQVINLEKDLTAIICKHAHTHDIDDVIEYYENIIAKLPGHVYWQDRNCVYLGCNDLQAKSAGLTSRKDIVGKTNRDLPWNYHAGSLPEELDAANREVMKTRKAVTIEEPGTLEGGKKLTFLSKKEPLINNKDEVIGLLGISFDITNLKRMEQELTNLANELSKANLQNSNILAFANQKLRNPLNDIVCSLELLSLSSLNEKQREHLGFLKESYNKIIEYLTYLDSYIKLNSGQDKIYLEEIDLYSTSAYIVEQLYQEALSKHLDIIIMLDKNMPQSIETDRASLERILKTLLCNAIKYTDKGHITLAINLISVNHTKKLLNIEITDTGRGIDAKQKNSLFDLFSKESAVEHYDKVGWRLSLIKEMLHYIDGSISLTSEPNKGSKFTVTIPFSKYKAKKATTSFEKLINQFKKLVFVEKDNCYFSSFCQYWQTNEPKQVLITQKSDTKHVYRAYPEHAIVIIDARIGNEIINEILYNQGDKQLLFVILTSDEMTPEINRPNVFYLLKPIYINVLPTLLTKIEYKFHYTAPKVLIIANDNITEKVFSDLLLELGCKVNVAVHQKGLITQRINKDYNVIFMDICLPIEPWLRTTKEILATRSDNPPAIFGISSAISDDDRGKCMNAGITDIFSKPVSIEKFRSIINLSKEQEQEDD